MENQNKSTFHNEGYENHLKMKTGHAGWHKQRMNNILSNLNVRQTDRVLDLGCGAGLFTKEIMKLSDNVTGLDYNDEALEICKKRGIKTAKGLSSDLSMFKDNSFDIITAVDFFEHITETITVETLKECYRILNKGGKIAIYSPNKDIYEFLRFNPVHIGLKKMEEIKQLLMHCKFEVSLQKYFPMHVKPFKWFYKTRRILVIGEKPQKQ